jgi:hypothetical protein
MSEEENKLMSLDDIIEQLEIHRDVETGAPRELFNQMVKSLKALRDRKCKSCGCILLDEQDGYCITCR